MKKYKLTNETIEHNGRILYRIEALKDFGIVKVGDKGGFVQSEINLSDFGNCWIYGEAKVYGLARVKDDAIIYNKAEVFDCATVEDNAEVCDDAKIYHHADIYGNALVCGSANVYGDAVVFGKAIICGDANVSSKRDYIVFKNWWSSGRYFTWTRSNNKWNVGCFYGTSDELIKKAYSDSELKGKEYERIVKYVNSILNDENK